MTDPVLLGACNDFLELQRIVRKRKDQLGWSNAVLAEVAGLPEAIVNKMLADPPKKNMGIMSFGLLLQAMGMYLVVAQDDGLMTRRVSRVTKRQEQQVRKVAMPIKRPVD